MITKTPQPETAPEKRFLADLTGRRAGLAALVLVAAYVVPVLLAWGLAWVLRADRPGEAGWVAPTAAMVVGLGLVVALTVRLGGWFAQLDFGEEYMLSFHPVAGYVLGWLRFVLQIGAGVLVGVLVVHVGKQATTERLTDAETEALPAYAALVPVPDGWDAQVGSLSQNEYGERPNAT